MTNHPEHVNAEQWAEGKDLCLTAHSLVESYAVLTRLPGDARMTASDAVKVINDRFCGVATLAEAKAAQVPAILAASGVQGGASYDGIVALTAQENNLTLASCDARAISTSGAIGVHTVAV